MKARELQCGDVFPLLVEMEVVKIARVGERVKVAVVLRNRGAVDFAHTCVEFTTKPSREFSACWHRRPAHPDDLTDVERALFEPEKIGARFQGRPDKKSALEP